MQRHSKWHCIKHSTFFRYKQIIKNLIKQRDKDSDFFRNWDFDLTFTIPENNEDVMRVKSAKVEYVDSLIDLIDKINSSKTQYSYDTLNDLLNVDIRNLIIQDDTDEKEA